MNDLFLNAFVLGLQFITAEQAIIEIAQAGLNDNELNQVYNAIKAPNFSFKQPVNQPLANVA